MRQRPTVELPDLKISNFDHEIPGGLEDVLREQEVYAVHCGWNFNGKVWWDGTQFVEDVWHYRQDVATYRANSLRELIELVNSEWGWE